MMGSPIRNLLWATNTSEGSSWSEEQFLHDYETNYMPRALAIGNMNTGLRYKNIDPSAKWPTLALYNPIDLTRPTDSDVAALHKEHQDAGITADVGAYNMIQTFEGQTPVDGCHGKILISVKMAPEHGTDAEFDEWYRKQHLDMLSMVKGYRRSTRWKLSLVIPSPEGTPEYLTLHEYDAVPPPEQMKLVVGTKWSKKIIGSAKAFVRDVWELEDVQGEGERI